MKSKADITKQHTHDEDKGGNASTRGFPET